MKRLWVLLALLAACRPTSTVAPEPAAAPSVGGLATLTESGDDGVATPVVGLDPPPPVEMPLPLGVTVVDITDGGRDAAFMWRGWFAGDPSDPRVNERIGEWYADGIERTATEAAYELYLEDVRNAGYPTDSYDMGDHRGFNFPLAEGELPIDGLVRLAPGDPNNPNNPFAPEVDVIEVIVGLRGG